MFRGKGISGKECSASIELLNTSASGINWFPGEKNPKDFKVVYENRTTVLIHSSGKKIIGVEHLSAAAIAFPNHEFALYAPQGELPLLDGSAKIWMDGLNNIAGVCRGVMHYALTTTPHFEITIDSRYLTFTPGPELEIEYTINRFGHEFTAHAQIPNDLEKVLSARTFIFEQELPAANLSEDLRGCGILLPHDKLRFENEPAYHKILDLLGDISVYSNMLPLGKFTVYNGGHELHHTACYRRIFCERQNLIFTPFDGDLK
ncbi:MAG: UDP-3-O-acyl-N-acetylglucosamine deacetylase [Fibromonadales bacterium]|nr:UDP-3-O-acyl-N-acetylglucosamine deacetylase [Fibromonadales bacterium]